MINGVTVTRDLLKKTQFAELKCPRAKIDVNSAISDLSDITKGTKCSISTLFRAKLTLGCFNGRYFDLQGAFLKQIFLNGCGMLR